MSAAAIIKELPRLTEAERRQVARQPAGLVVEHEGGGARREADKQLKMGRDVMRRYRNARHELEMRP